MDGYLRYCESSGGRRSTWSCTSGERETGRRGVAANEGSRSEEGGTKRTVYAALAANLLIAAAQFVAGFALG